MRPAAGQCRCSAGWAEDPFCRSRKLAYPINYKTEGYYVLMTFTSEPSFPKELDRVLRITDGIMRSLIVCKGE